jgi:hypothetical protein
MPQLKTLPNQFELRGTGVTISYSVTSITGKPQLRFKKGRQTLNFSGDEIGVFDTTIGSLITVTIAKTVDQGFTTFSFLLPSIQLSSPSAKQSFRTIGITTVHKTTIAGPPKGVQQAYKFVQLRSTAQALTF